MKILFALANSADPDEKLHDAAFHLGLHFFTKNTFRSKQHLKGLKETYMHMY